MAQMSNSGGGIFADINITPLTDIFLVLLIIFMVAAAVTIESAAHVGIPGRGAKAAQRKIRNVTVMLTTQRKIYVDDKPVTLAQLEPALRKDLAESSNKVVIFKGDPKVILGDMVVVLDLAKRAGAQRLGITVAGSNGPAHAVGP